MRRPIPLPRPVQVLLGLNAAAWLCLSCASDSEAVLVENPREAPAAAGPTTALEQRAEGKGASLQKPSASPSPEAAPTRPPPLPFPSNMSLFALKSFMDEFRDAYVAWLPLNTEYTLYFRTLAGERDPTLAELDGLRTRVLDDKERSHWVWMAGCLELLDYLVGSGQQRLQEDRERNYVARMKVLAFVAKELSESTGNPKYLDMARSLYMDTSLRYFGRQIVIRDKAN